MFHPLRSGEFGFPKERRGKVIKLFVRRVIFNLIWCIIIMLQANDICEDFSLLSLIIVLFTLLLGLLRQQDRVDVRQDATTRNRDRPQQLGQSLVVSDGQLDVSRYDSGFFVISGGVPGEFENFRR